MDTLPKKKNFDDADGPAQTTQNIAGGPARIIRRRYGIPNRKIIFATGAIFLVVILFLAVSVFKKQPQDLKNKDISSKLSLQVSYELFNENYTVPIVVIKNQNNKQWEDCEIKINDQYINKIAELPIIDSENNIKIIPITNFVRSDGVKFNYSTNIPKSACVSCNKPNYGVYCGKFGYASE